MHIKNIYFVRGMKYRPCLQQQKVKEGLISKLISFTANLLRSSNVSLFLFHFVLSPCPVECQFLC